MKGLMNMNMYQIVAMTISVATIVVGVTYYLSNMGNYFLENLIKIELNKTKSRGEVVLHIATFVSYLFIGGIMIYITNHRNNSSNISEKTLIKISDGIVFLNRFSEYYFAAIIVCLCVLMFGFEYFTKTAFNRKGKIKEWFSIFPVIFTIMSSLICSFGVYFNIENNNITFSLVFMTVYFCIIFTVSSLISTLISIYNIKISTICFSNKNKIDCKVVFDHNEFFVVTQDGKNFVYLNKKNIEGIHTKKLADTKL